MSSLFTSNPTSKSILCELSHQSSAKRHAPASQPWMIWSPQKALVQEQVRIPFMPTHTWPRPDRARPDSTWAARNANNQMESVGHAQPAEAHTVDMQSDQLSCRIASRSWKTAGNPSLAMAGYAWKVGKQLGPALEKDQTVTAWRRHRNAWARHFRL